MAYKVRDLEDAGLHMTLREIANKFVLTRSVAEISDEEYDRAEPYAQRKIVREEVFASDPELAHVYLGRIIGEVVLENRFCDFLNAASRLMTELNADVMKTEPVA